MSPGRPGWTHGAAAPALPPEWLDPPDIATARAAQLALAARVVRDDAIGPVRRIGGVDISSTRFDPEGRIYAAVVVLDWPGLQVVATATAEARATMPYVPGYLGFREVPALLTAWARLAEPPDLVLVDGHGIAHPRGFGIATHLGVVLDVPSIGVAKSPLVGRPEAPQLSHQKMQTHSRNLQNQSPRSNPRRRFKGQPRRPTRQLRVEYHSRMPR